MRRDSKLSDVLHVLLHMADHEGPLTSGSLARMMSSNPVVVRRVLGGLRNCGLVSATKGRSGGWVLACDLARVTLRDIYAAVGSPALFAFGSRKQESTCLVERAVNQALTQSIRDAEALLLERFGSITLADLHQGFHRDMAALRAAQVESGE